MKITNIKDSTLLTSDGVRFLTKQPIVGIKIFDGERLRKRLQITFATEGNFNLFVNKSRQWLDIDIRDQAPTSEVYLTGENSQTNYLTQTPQTEPISQASSQILEHSQNSQATLYSQQSTQNVSRQLQLGTHAAQPFNSNSIRMSQSVSDSAAKSEQVHSNTCISAPRNIFQIKPECPQILEPSHNSASYPVVTALDDNTSVVSQSTQLFHTEPAIGTTQHESSLTDALWVTPITGEDITRALHDIPFAPRLKKRTLQPSSQREMPVMEKLLENVLTVIALEQDRYLTLNDEQFALKLVQRLKSESFRKLLERVENVIE